MLNFYSCPDEWENVRGESNKPAELDLTNHKRNLITGTGHATDVFPCRWVDKASTSTSYLDVKTAVLNSYLRRENCSCIFIHK